MAFSTLKPIAMDRGSSRDNNDCICGCMRPQWQIDRLVAQAGYLLLFLFTVLWERHKLFLLFGLALAGSGRHFCVSWVCLEEGNEERMYRRSAGELTGRLERDRELTFLGARGSRPQCSLARSTAGLGRSGWVVQAPFGPFVVIQELCRVAQIAPPFHAETRARAGATAPLLAARETCMQWPARTTSASASEHQGVR